GRLRAPSDTRGARPRLVSRGSRAAHGRARQARPVARQRDADTGLTGRRYARSHGDRSARGHRPRSSEGERHRPCARVLSRHPRLRGDAALRRPGRVHLGRWLPPPHQPAHVGVERRVPSAAGDDRPVPRGDPLSGPQGARAGPEAAGRGECPDRRRNGSRRERGDLSPRSGRQRDRALPRPAGGRVAARRRWEHVDGFGAARPGRAPRRSRVTPSGMKSSRRRILTVAGLFVASLFCVALVVVRNVHTGNGNFRFLIWNLFLAWIPFLLAVVVYDRWRRRRGGALLLALGALWLLFFPNAPYIATDFVHLQHAPLSAYWYDAVTIAAFAWLGVLIGFASLYLMQTVVRQWRGVVAGWVFAVFAIGLGSLGIYLG